MMKKLLIFGSLVIAIFSGLLLNNVLGTTSTTTVTTDNELTTLYDGQYYYYSDYQDLISQIYADVHDNLYSQIYADVVEELTDDLYEEIYSLVEDQLLDLLTEDEFELYIDTLQEDIHDVVNLADTSVFGVTSYHDGGEISIGSGVVYKYDDLNNLFYIITNHHVIEDGADFEIYLPDETTVDATLIGYDTEVDIAVLTFSSVGLSNIVVSLLGNTTETQVSEFVLAVGSPMGYNFFNSMNLGIVSGLNRKVDTNRYIDYIQHDAAINSGNSGGPIYNLQGEVIGINVSKYAEVDIEGMGFAIPIDLVKRVVTRIENDDIPYNTIMPRIGASYYMVSENIEGSNVNIASISNNGTDYDDLTISLPTGITNGLIINSVDSLGTLDGFLDGGDLIVEIDSYSITDKISFQDYLYANYESGDTIPISYYAYNPISNTFNSALSTIDLELK